MAIQLPSFSFLAQPGESPAKGLLQGLKAGFSISEQMSQNKTRTAQREQMQLQAQRQQLISGILADADLTKEQRGKRLIQAGGLEEAGKLQAIEVAGQKVKQAKERIDIAERGVVVDEVREKRLKAAADKNELLTKHLGGLAEQVYVANNPETFGEKVSTQMQKILSTKMNLKQKLTQVPAPTSNEIGIAARIFSSLKIKGETIEGELDEDDAKLYRDFLVTEAKAAMRRRGVAGDPAGLSKEILRQHDKHKEAIEDSKVPIKFGFNNFVLNVDRLQAEAPSAEDIKFTAEEHGISEEEVMRRLGQ